MKKQSVHAYLNSKSSGFTLVELAVVMVIIGLLIGGILKGGELIKNMQVTRTITDIRAIQVATTQFQEKYAAMPGDIINAVGRIPGCNGATNCVNGNGNNCIGGTRGVDDVAWRTYVANRSETVQFWKHLALGNFVTTVNSGADPVADLAWSETHPSAAVGGGYEFYYDALTTIGFAGHIMRISSNGPVSGSSITGVLSPDQAAQIDRKMDNGMARSGDVFADYGVNNNACKTGEVYNEGNSATCLLYIRIFR